MNFYNKYTGVTFDICLFFLFTCDICGLCDIYGQCDICRLCDIYRLCDICGLCDIHGLCDVYRRGVTPLAKIGEGVMHQSIPSANFPRAKPREFFEVVKSPATGQNFSAKARPRDKKTSTPGEYFERSSHLFLLIGFEILEFCRYQTLKRTGRLSIYSLVIPTSFRLSTILKVSKFSPSFETDFVTREQQQMV